MSDTSRTPSEPAQRGLEAAITGLEGLRDLLVRAGRGDADVGAVRAELQRYWREHRSALAQVAGAVGEQVRAQMLQQLYQWRAQLERQPPRS